MGDAVVFFVLAAVALGVSIPLEGAGAWWVRIAAAVLASMGGAFLEGSIAEAVRERWPRLYAWWGDTGGLVLRHLVLLVFFAGAAVFFGLLALGVVGGHAPAPPMLVIALPPAGMAVWSLIVLAGELRRRSVRKGYGRSDDGSWSAG